MERDEMKRLMITPDTIIKQAMEVIDKGSRGIALVIDEGERLIGTITDGDVRRAILKGISLNDSIKLIMNENFTFVSEHYSRTLIETLFLRKAISQIPVLDDDMRLTDLIFQYEFFLKETKDNWVVIMAGGLGTRLSSLTRDIPKPMLRVGPKPIIETIIDQMKSYGYTNIVLCLNYKAEIIQNYFQDGSNFGVNIQYVTEKKRLGTAGAIRLAKQYITKSFFVLNGDILTKLNFEQFMNYHLKHKNTMTIGTKKYDMQIPYGVVDIREESVVSLKEKPEIGFFINGGMYCLEPDVIDLIPEDEYFDITKLIDICLKTDRKVGSFPITEYWMDIGQMDDFSKANTDYQDLFREGSNEAGK